MGFPFPQMHVENNKQIFKTDTKRYKESNNTKSHRKYWVKLLIFKQLAKKIQKYGLDKLGNYETRTTMNLGNFNFDMPVQPFLDEEASS